MGGEKMSGVIAKLIGLVLAATLGLLSFSSNVLGDELSDPNSVEIAQNLFNDGARAYASGDFIDALMAFRKAHTYVPESVFLYNAARAAKRLGNFDQALSLANDAAAQKERPLPAIIADKNRELIAELKTSIAAR